MDLNSVMLKSSIKNLCFSSRVFHPTCLLLLMESYLALGKI